MPYTLVLSREIKFYILQKQLVKIASAFAVGLFLAIITSLVTQSSTAHAASQPSTTGDRESTIRATHTPRSKLGTASKAALHGVRNTTKKQAQTSPAYNPPPYNPPPYNPPPYNPPPYNPPAYNPPPYNPPAYNPPAYNPPAYNPPAYNPPAYNPPAYNPPAYNPPAYNPPAYNPPAHKG